MTETLFYHLERRSLDDVLPGLIEKMYFPKTMYWTGKTGPRFIRPIRWIVALFGDRVVPFEIAGVPESTAKKALVRVAMKMPVRCRFVGRRITV